jgi:hypothetical protein
MLGLKVFKRATETISGIKLLRRIRKRQFVFDHLGTKGQAAPSIWSAVLST